MVSRSLQFVLLVVGVTLVLPTAALAAPLAPVASVADTGCAYVVTRDGRDAPLVVVLEGPAGLMFSVQVAPPARTRDIGSHVDLDACIRATGGPVCDDRAACCERQPDPCAPMALADPLYLEREYGHDVGPFSFCVYLRVDDQGIDSDADLTRNCYAPPPGPGADPDPT